MPITNNMLKADKFDFTKFEHDVRAAASAHGWSLIYLSEELLTRSKTYLHTVFYKMAITMRAALVLCKELGLKLQDYEIKPEPPKPEPEPEPNVMLAVGNEKGWTNTLYVNHTAKIVSLAFFKDGIKVASGRAKIFDETERGIMQAISYAAHMCYKFSEQKELFNQNLTNNTGGCACKTTNSTASTQTYRL